MRGLKIIAFVLFLVLVSAPAWGQLSAEQAYQIALRSKRDSTATVGTSYVIVDRLEDDSTLMPPPVTEGPLAVAYFMWVKKPDLDFPKLEEFYINYYTGDVWAKYDEWGHRERSQGWQGGPRLSRDQCYNIALNFVRQRFPEFDQRNMILSEHVSAMGQRQNDMGETIEDTIYHFTWSEIYPSSGTLSMNSCEVGVWDVTGEVLEYLETLRTPRISLAPTLTEAQALSNALDYLQFAHGVGLPGDPYGIGLMSNEERGYPGQSRLMFHEDEFLTQRLVWFFPFTRTQDDAGFAFMEIWVDAHTGEIVEEHGFAGMLLTKGKGGQKLKTKRVRVPRQFAYRPSPWQRGKLILLVKGWNREPIESEPLTDKAGKMVNLPGMKVTQWRETSVWRKAELHKLNYPPLQRDGRNWLVVDYFKGFRAQLKWKGQQVEIVGKRGLVTKHTPRWIKGKPYLPARVLEEVALARLWWDEKERALVARLARQPFDHTSRTLAQQQRGGTH
jgi:hypothetical protein